MPRYDIGTTLADADLVDAGDSLRGSTDWSWKNAESYSSCARIDNDYWESAPGLAVLGPDNL